jgi:hypothetical protein
VDLWSKKERERDGGMLKGNVDCFVLWQWFGLNRSESKHKTQMWALQFEASQELKWS